MFRRIRLQNFKTFEDFTISLDHTNVLVGSNNAGKSTVLDAFRALSGGLRFAAQRRAQHIQTAPGELHVGYSIPLTSIPITTKNIHTDYRDQDAILTFTLINGRSLKMIFPSAGGCYLILDASLIQVSTVRRFRELYPIKVNIVPTLGPIEEEEDYLTDEYYAQVWQSRRSHRYFRNIWLRQDESRFLDLNKLVEETWPAMRLHAPEREGYAPVRLVMFCEENRRLREIYWAGFGFQIWIQFLTHLLLATTGSLLVVDEPDIYLHPELQRRLYDLLLRTGHQFVLATHSSEIINEADPDDVVMIDRGKRHGKRIKDVEGLQVVLNRIGSNQNIYLTRLSRARKVLFVEGHDFGLIRRFARRLGLRYLSEGERITPVPLEGYSNAARIEDVAWGFEKVLRADIKLAVFLDRDYRCDEEVLKRMQEIGASVSHAFILQQKEIENYLLCPRSIALAAESRRLARPSIEESRVITPEHILCVIDRACEDMKIRVRANLDDFRLRFHEGSHLSRATILRDGAVHFDKNWQTFEGKVALVPGKEALARVNDWLQREHGVSVTGASALTHSDDSA